MAARVHPPMAQSRVTLRSYKVRRQSMALHSRRPGNSKPDICPFGSASGQGIREFESRNLDQNGYSRLTASMRIMLRFYVVGPQRDEALSCRASPQADWRFCSRST